MPGKIGTRRAHGASLRRLAGVVGVAFICAVLAAFLAMGASQPAAEPGASMLEASAFASPAPVGQGDRHSAGEPARIVLAGEGSHYRSDSVVVRFADGVDCESLSSALDSTGCIAQAQIAEADLEKGFAALPLREGVDVGTALTELSSVCGIASAQPNFVYRLAEDAATGFSASGEARPLAFGSLAEGTGADEASGELSTREIEVDDPRAASQWHLDGATGIHAYEAWSLAKGEQGDPPVAIAVMDTGCRLSHEDLAGNIVATYDATGAGISDIDGHGSHVCGVASAVTDNGVGVAGVAFNAKLLPIQVFDFKDGELIADTASLLEAYRFLGENADAYNVRVVNLSLGAQQDSCELEDRALIDAVEGAYQAGILTVCAAGNGAYRKAYTCFPCDYLEHGIGVIALDQSRGRASYSNYNLRDQTTKDLAAPGSSIMSSYRDSDSSYTASNGTSMATPVVAGVAALVFTACPALDPGDVIDILHETATDIGPAGFDSGTGYGEVNAYEAVKLALARTADGDGEGDGDDDGGGGALMGKSESADGEEADSGSGDAPDEGAPEGPADSARPDPSAGLPEGGVPGEVELGQPDGAGTGSTRPKGRQTIAVKTKVGTVSARALRAKARKITCIVKVTGAKTAVSYLKRGGSKRLSVNAGNGKVTVRKGTRKNVYKLKVKIVATASDSYRKSNVVKKTLIVTVK